MEQAVRKRLRTGYTTGACATAAARAAFFALRHGRFPDPVTITLPGGEQPAFPLVLKAHEPGMARAGVIKDAGDDPDITHGALIIAEVRPARAGQGIRFHAGEGVGIVTLPGLPVPVGEPAINPGPRLMIREALTQDNDGCEPDLDVILSIPGGEKLAQRTMNPRLGIVGGLSILGTTGIVRPYSCAAWIASIRESVDVARALKLAHIAGCTGRTSERAVQAHYGLSDQALIDMGDFVGGLLKYLRHHPVPRLTIAGGPGKLAKLGQGALNLHSRRTRLNRAALAEAAAKAGADAQVCTIIHEAPTVAAMVKALEGSAFDLSALIAKSALKTVRAVLGDAPVRADVLVISARGEVLAHAE
nr:cobalt-precorrin-5B (C(1))-methyltransferase [Thermopetrobacter sp. TC1]